MRQLDENLWVAEAPLRFLGLEMGARMTIVRLPGSKLLLISPIGATPELIDEVGTLGSVDYLVAPNRLHHLYVEQWQSQFPDAALFVAPGLDTKRDDLDVTGVLDDSPERGWTGTLDQCVIQGFPFTNEVVFFHRPSATLVLTDLAFHIGPASPRLTRIAFRLMGAYGRLSYTPLERLLIKDKGAFRSSLERVLRWPFERIIVAHGEVLEQGGPHALRKTYTWALKT